LFFFANVTLSATAPQKARCYTFFHANEKKAEKLNANRISTSFLDFQKVISQFFSVLGAERATQP
jgi:hypothetical protein